MTHVDAGSGETESYGVGAARSERKEGLKGAVEAESAGMEMLRAGQWKTAGEAEVEVRWEREDR
jgi:hypothetical protein